MTDTTIDITALAGPFLEKIRALRAEREQGGELSEEDVMLVLEELRDSALYPALEAVADVEGVADMSIEELSELISEVLAEIVAEAAGE